MFICIQHRDFLTNRIYVYVRIFFSYMNEVLKG